MIVGDAAERGGAASSRVLLLVRREVRAGEEAVLPLRLVLDVLDPHEAEAA